MNPIHDYIISVILEKISSMRIKVMGVIGNISLKVIDGIVVNIEYEHCNVRFAFLQVLRLEKMFASEASHEDLKVGTKDGKNFKNLELVKSFQEKN